MHQQGGKEDKKNRLTWRWRIVRHLCAHGDHEWQCSFALQHFLQKPEKLCDLVKKSITQTMIWVLHYQPSTSKNSVMKLGSLQRTPNTNLLRKEMGKAKCKQNHQNSITSVKNCISTLTNFFKKWCFEESLSSSGSHPHMEATCNDTSQSKLSFS